jgi:thiamine-monophosphate kinase
MAVEGVHFDLGWMTAEDAGWRALALALGDLAAKGASPTWALTSVAVPTSWKVDDFVGLFTGMHALAAKVGMVIEGGDMSAIDGPAVLSLTVAGHASRRPLPRSAAKPGWSVAVTGPLGGAALALRQRRALRLEPLLDEGKRLNELGLCCGDISDGLVREMEKFAEMSGCGCELRANDVPVAAEASLDDALTSGEEVQFVCVGPEEIVRRAGLTTVGVLTRERAVNLEGAEVARRGYDHFA